MFHKLYARTKSFYFVFMTYYKALFFSFPRLALRARVALRAKYRVRPAWLIKRLSCRLVLFSHLFSLRYFPGWRKLVAKVQCTRENRYFSRLTLLLPLSYQTTASTVHSKVLGLL